MPKLIFIDATGAVHEVDAEIGVSVMDAAIKAGVPGIEARCGGSCICATCHSYIDARWLAQLAAPDEIEEAMLECTPEPKSNSRLTCQLPVTEELEGMIIQVPESQH